MWLSAAQAGQLQTLRAAAAAPQSQDPKAGGRRWLLSKPSHGPPGMARHRMAFTRRLGLHQGKPFLYNDGQRWFVVARVCHKYRVGSTSLLNLGPLVLEGDLGEEDFILGVVSFPFQKGPKLYSSGNSVFPLISGNPVSQSEVST